MRAMMREDIEITMNFADAGVRRVRVDIRRRLYRLPGRPAGAGGTIEAKFRGARAPGTPAIHP